jgi:chaperonin GroES
MDYKPVQNRVVIKRVGETVRTTNGILLTSVALEKPATGKIIAVGDGRTTNKGILLPMNVKVGDLVIFGKEAGIPIKLYGEDYLIMREDDIIGILDDNEEVVNG